MAEFPFLPLSTDAFIGDTADLNAAQTGAYALLFCAAWRSPTCALPDDDQRLARIARLGKAAWLKNKPAIMNGWQKGEDGFWCHPYLTKQRAFVAERSKKNSANIQRRWLKNNDSGYTNILPKSYQSLTPTPTPIPTITPTAVIAGRRNEHEGSSLIQPQIWRDNELPSSWDTLAEQAGLSHDQIYDLWTKFKDRSTSLPWRVQNWMAWVRQELVYKKRVANV